MAKQVERLRDLGSGRRDAIMMDPKSAIIPVSGAMLVPSRMTVRYYR